MCFILSLSIIQEIYRNSFMTELFVVFKFFLYVFLNKKVHIKSLNLFKKYKWNLFISVIMKGFKCADKKNSDKKRIEYVKKLSFSSRDYLLS